MGVLCAVGRLHADSHTVTAVGVRDGADPAAMVATLRQMLHQNPNSEVRQLLQRVLAHGWVRLDPQGELSDDPTLVTVAGIGVTWPDPPPPKRRDLQRAVRRNRAEWLYLLDERDGAVTVFEATVHGRWAWHSHHRLSGPPDHHQTAGVAGDAATGHGTHRWRPAVVSLDGLHTAWPGEICTVEHDRGVVVARVDEDTLIEIIATTARWHHDRLPGSGLPVLALEDGVLVVTWFAGTGHAQDQYIHGDDADRYILGPHLCRWILPAEQPPTTPTAVLRNGTPPILEWATEAAVHTCHPILAPYRLAHLAATPCTPSPAASRSWHPPMASPPTTCGCSPPATP